MTLLYGSLGSKVDTVVNNFISNFEGWAFAECRENMHD